MFDEYFTVITPLQPQLKVWHCCLHCCLLKVWQLCYNVIGCMYFCIEWRNKVAAHLDHLAPPSNSKHNLWSAINALMLTVDKYTINTNLICVLVCVNESVWVLWQGKPSLKWGLYSALSWIRHPWWLYENQPFACVGHIHAYKLVSKVNLCGAGWHLGWRRLDGGASELEEWGAFKSQEQWGWFAVRDPLLAAVNGELHTFLTVVCAAARWRKKRRKRITGREETGKERETEGERRQREGYLSLADSICNFLLHCSSICISRWLITGWPCLASDLAVVSQSVKITKVFVKSFQSVSATEDHIAGVRHTTMSSSTLLLEPPAGPFHKLGLCTNSQNFSGLHHNQLFWPTVLKQTWNLYTCICIIFPYIAFKQLLHCNQQPNECIQYNTHIVTVHWIHKFCSKVQSSSKDTYYFTMK